MRSRSLFHRRRHVQCLAGLLLCLLTQQLAIAAQVCAGPAPMIGCAMTMPSNETSQPGGTDQRSCVSHCTAQASAPSDAHALNAPASPWVALPLAISAVHPQRPVHAAIASRYPLRPPPRSHALLFCSLLI